MDVEICLIARETWSKADFRQHVQVVEAEVKYRAKQQQSSLESTEHCLQQVTPYA